MSDPENSTRRGGRGKVKRLIQQYGLDGFGAELEDSWLGTVGQRRSLRELADYFNRHVLEAAMKNVDMELVDGEVENTYRLLTHDDVSSGTRIQIRNRLERNGIDVDRLERDFVSRQAIHTYLTDYRDVSYSSPKPSTGDRIDQQLETIQRLRNRVVAVTERILTTLSNVGHITIGNFDVLVSIRVQCVDCGNQYDVADLLTNRGCDCES